MNALLKTLTLLLVLLSSLNADETGSASIFSFYNGVALEKNEVLVDGEYKYFTDEDGSVELILETGKHQIEIFAKDENGQNLGYTKKTIEIKESRDTQVIATFKDDSLTPYVDVDTPVGKLAKEMDVTENTGILHGLVLSTEKNLPIANARVFVKGTSIDAKTDEKGNFYVEIPADIAVSISIVHSEYSAQTINDILVKKDETINTEVKLTPASMELEEFVVLAPKVEGSISSLVAEVKDSASISNVIGSEQMSKQGDSNAAAALKRVAGVTIIGGKYVYVRGLGDRYSATELNGMSVPSPSPIKRSVPLDMFPTSVIGSLQIQKSATADITGAFGGGYVNIRSKEKFNNDYVKLKAGLEVHDSYGSDVISSNRGVNDWTGKDDGYRAFPESFTDTITAKPGEAKPTLPLDDTQMQTMISKRSYNHNNTKVGLGGSGGIEFGKKIEISDNQELYILGGYGYKYKTKNINYSDYSYDISSSGEQADTPFNTSETQRLVNTIQHGGMLNIAYRYKSLDLKLLKLHVLNTLDQSRFAEGTYGDNQSQEQQTIFEWQERELDVNQFTGGFDYEIFVPNRFDFGVEYATANEYVPNDVAYDYKKRNTAGAPYQFERNNSELDFLNRTTDDALANVYLKNRTEVPILGDDDYVEIGLNLEGKVRESRVNRIEMISKERNTTITTGEIDTVIANDSSQLRFSLDSQAKDSFNAALKQNSYYATTSLNPTSKTNFTFGVRYTDLDQSINEFAIKNNIVTESTNSLEFQKMLPSASYKYEFDKANQIKVAYAQTYVYPDFREFSNSEFIHPVFIAKVTGNPDLVETDIESIDFQYGHYFNDTDNITASLFYKHMDNPIEDTREFTSSTLDRFGFQNSESADLAGVELSWYKNLGFIHNYANDFTFYGNYTFIHSEVTLTPEQKEKYVTDERGLQGLSPQVINLSLIYQNKARAVNLSYNKMSERLMRVALKNGNVILGLDDYEEPPHLLDLTWIEHFKWRAIQTDVDLKFKLKNLLDGTTVWRQKEKVTLEYKTGRSLAVELSFKI